MFTFKHWCFTSFQAITSVLVGRMWQICDLKLAVQILIYKQNLLSQRLFQFTINYYLSTEVICYRNHENLNAKK